MNSPNFTICIIASRRPDLLSETLMSFGEHFIKQVNIKKTIVNIDPIFGDEEKHSQTISVINDFFPDALIFEPISPNFSAAVKRVWAQCDDMPVLHLEDDWILNEDVDLERLLSLFDSTTKAVSFLSAEHGDKGIGNLSEAKVHKRFLGLTYSKTTETRFNTSPGVFDGSFLRTVSSLIDTSLDPEKQMRKGGKNLKLFNYLQNFKCAFYKRSDSDPIAIDIGRKWREKQGIQKLLKHGQSVWVNNNY